MSLLSGIGGLVEKIMNRHFDSIGVGGQKVKILVAQHFPCTLPSCFDNREVFVPIHSGRALSEPIPGIIGDDTGENISKYNGFLNEITAIYWAGMHYDELSAPDYVGFNHYRRYLEWSYDLLNERVIVANRVPMLKSIYDTFGTYHHLADIDEFLVRFKNEFGEECVDVDEYFRTHMMYMANLFLMDKETFLLYNRFLGRCLKVVFSMIKDNVIKLESYDKYQKRVYGFIMERMTGYFIYRARHRWHVPFVSARVRNFDIANVINGNR